MRRAIQAGIVANCLIYLISIIIWSRTSTPNPGQTWEAMIVDGYLHPDFFEFKFAEGQAPVVVALDVYMFLLPFPALTRLRLSLKAKIRFVAVFGTALL